jgi:hypothetical protein
MSSPRNLRIDVPQDRAFALGQRSGDFPVVLGAARLVVWLRSRAALGAGGETSTLWGDRMRAGRKVGPHRCRYLLLKARSRGRRRCEPPGRCLRRLLEPGCLAAPERHCLALLPSGPDAVRRLPVRGTWLSTLRAPAQTPDDSAPQAVLGPAIADCGFREPLAPRLARPGRTMVAHRRRLSFPGRVAQRESARLTRERSLVRSQPRPSSGWKSGDFQPGVVLSESPQ